MIDFHPAVALPNRTPSPGAARPSLPLLLLLEGLAFWPVWRWYGLRMLDPSDEPWGLVPLLTLCVFLFWTRKTIPLSKQPSSLLSLGALMLLYALVFPLSPPLVRAALALTIVGYTISRYGLGRRLSLSIWGLLLLSLPLLPTLQFYLGYPLRATTASLAASLLHLNGFVVAREGTSLGWNGLFISVDAPCSGVQMLWAGLFLAFTLSAFLNHRTGPTVRVAFLAVVATLAGNVLRAAALFYTESGILEAPGWLHEAVGLTVFAAMAGGLVWYASRLTDTPCQPEEDT